MAKWIIGCCTNTYELTMKIISKRKDYYDYLSGVWGIDNKVVYKREPKFEHYKNDFIARPFDFKLNGQSYLYSYCILWFCDKAYPFLEITYKYYPWGVLGYSETIVEQRIWSYDKYVESKFNVQSDYINKNIKQFFNENRNEALNTKFNSPQILISDSRDAQTDILLKDIDFSSEMTAEQAYQQVAMFVAAKPEPPQQVPTDMHRFEAKGFDKKKSFRKRKV